MTPIELERRFPAVLRAVEYLNEPSDTAMARLTDLLKRHGTSVADVMRTTAASNRAEQFPNNSLPTLYGDLLRFRAIADLGIPALERIDEPAVRSVEMVFDRSDQPHLSGPV